MKTLTTFTLCLLSLALSAQRVEKVESIGLTVSDMEKALYFYTQVLPFKKISESEYFGENVERLKGLFGIRYKKVKLTLGDETLELTDYLTPGGRPVPPDSKSNDLWFQHIAIVVSNMDSAYAHLRKHNVVHVSNSPQTLPKSIPAAEGIKAFYFQDPDGHNLELIFFPEKKGDPKWQRHTNSKLFLGIDHTAIGISNTVASKHFYGDLLGIKYQGESFNAGVEQEHLNNVFGAMLHISGNKTTAGPGIEFLEYIAPKTGRVYPKDSRADDLIHWETIVSTKNIEQLYTRLKNAGAQFISPDIVTIEEQSSSFQKGFYVRDPDGHVVGVVESVTSSNSAIAK